MKHLKVITNKRIESDLEVGLNHPIEAGATLHLCAQKNCVQCRKKKYLKIRGGKNDLNIPAGSFFIPYRKKEYLVFLTEHHTDHALLFAIDGKFEGAALLEKIQQGDYPTIKTPVLKVEIRENKVAKTKVDISEIRSLF